MFLGVAVFDQVPASQLASLSTDTVPVSTDTVLVSTDTVLVSTDTVPVSVAAMTVLTVSTTAPTLATSDHHKRKRNQRARDRRKRKKIATKGASVPTAAAAAGAVAGSGSETPAASVPPRPQQPQLVPEPAAAAAAAAGAAAGSGSETPAASVPPQPQQQPPQLEPYYTYLKLQAATEHEERGASWDRKVKGPGVWVLWDGTPHWELNRLADVLGWKDEDGPEEAARWRQTVLTEVLADPTKEFAPVGDVTVVEIGPGAEFTAFAQRFRHRQGFGCLWFALFNLLGSPRKQEARARKRQLMTVDMLRAYVAEQGLPATLGPVYTATLAQLLARKGGRALILRKGHAFGVQFGSPGHFFDGGSRYASVFSRRTATAYGWSGAVFEVVDVS
eukprot:g29411.t1